MSYDIRVSVPVWPPDLLARWAAELTAMGLQVAFDAAFDPASSMGWCPLKVSVTNAATPLPLARTLARKKTFESGFEYFPSADGALFSANVDAGNAVAIWCAVALAAVVGGTVEEPQLGATATGDSGLAIVARLAADPAFVAGIAGPGPKPKKPPASPRAAVKADPSKPVRPYAASGTFEVGERITHPSFGEGVVEVSAPGKLTAFFSGTRRVLIQAGGDAKTSLARPGRIDHVVPGGKQKV